MKRRLCPPSYGRKVKKEECDMNATNGDLFDQTMQKTYLWISDLMRELH